jgi:uncharacterized membrane protein YphA (DoxX/SURF4 family)
MDSRLNSAFWSLRIGLGLAAFLAGLDKFFNLLADWGSYLAPSLARLLPVSTPAAMHLAGVIEMIAGLALLAGITRLGGYVVMAWLLLIALTLLAGGHYFDVAVRDVEMAIAAFTLAKLSEVRAVATAGAPAALHQRTA